MLAVRKLVLLLSGLALLGLSSSWAGEATSVEKKKAELLLRGASLWPNYCGNCHNARGPSDRSPVDWDLIMMHMRARANLPPDVGEAIREYLQKR